MNKIFLVLLILIIGITLGLGSIGFIPFLSSALGADKPKNLGITYPSDMPKQMQTQYGPEITVSNDSGSLNQSIVFTGSKPITYALTSEEITALMNFRHWKYYPLSNVQIKIHPDGTVESSGVINVSTSLAAIEAYGFNVADVRKAINDYHIPIVAMPFYAKFKGGIENNAITLSIQSFEAGKLPIPQSIIVSNTGRVVQALEALESKHAGFSVKKMSFEDGKVHFDGTVPEKEIAVGQ